MKMQEPKVSIIVPFYNSEKFLNECLISIQQQDFDNFEVILVDDGSTDFSPSIANLFCKTDSRFKLFHKNNEGPSLARNFGISIAKGKFVCFIDSDDVVATNLLSSLLLAIKDSHSDIAICKLIYWLPPYNKPTVCNSRANFVSSTDRKNFLKNIFSLKQTEKKFEYPGGFACAKLFRNELLKNESFPPTKVAEDEYFLFYLTRKIKSVCYLDQGLYFYRQNSNSLSRIPSYSIQHLENRFKLLRGSTSKIEETITQQAIYQSLIAYTLNLFISDHPPSLSLISRFYYYVNKCKQLKKDNLELRDSIQSKYYSLKYALFLYKLPPCVLFVLIWLARNLLLFPRLYGLIKARKS